MDARHGRNTLTAPHPAHVAHDAAFSPTLIPALRLSYHIPPPEYAGLTSPALESRKWHMRLPAVEWANDGPACASRARLEVHAPLARRAPGFSYVVSDERNVERKSYRVASITAGDYNDDSRYAEWQQVNGNVTPTRPALMAYKSELFNAYQVALDADRASSAATNHALQLAASDLEYEGTRVKSPVLGRDLNPMGRGDGTYYANGGNTMGGSVAARGAKPVLVGSITGGYGSSVNNQGGLVPDDTQSNKEERRTAGVGTSSSMSYNRCTKEEIRACEITRDNIYSETAASISSAFGEYRSQIDVLSRRIAEIDKQLEEELNKCYDEWKARVRRCEYEYLRKKHHAQYMEAGLGFVSLGAPLPIRLSGVSWIGIIAYFGAATHSTMSAARNAYEDMVCHCLATRAFARCMLNWVQEDLRKEKGVLVMQQAQALGQFHSEFNAAASDANARLHALRCCAVQLYTISPMGQTDYDRTFDFYVHRPDPTSYYYAYIRKCGNEEGGRPEATESDFTKLIPVIPIWKQDNQYRLG